MTGCGPYLGMSIWLSGLRPLQPTSWHLDLHLGIWLRFTPHLGVRGALVVPTSFRGASERAPHLGTSLNLVTVLQYRPDLKLRHL